MNNGLSKKYGLFTAIAMVVGVVIGSGIFFKTEDILVKTGGNIPIGLMAILICGAIMIICANTFAGMSMKYEKVNGMVDYAEVACGPGYAYGMGWFLSVFYYPSITSVLAWVSARFFSELCGFENPVTGGNTMLIAGFFLILSYALNTLSPKLAGKFQVSSTVIKLVPLVLMAIVGTIVGIFNGNIAEGVESITNVPKDMSYAETFFTAIVAMAFAYEGWIVATSINAELKNAKKTLPLALTLGSIIVVAIYALYYIGITGGASSEELIKNGSTVAFKNIFGPVISKLLTAFIVVSCLGTLNGLMLGVTRGMYSLAARNLGPAPKAMKEISPYTGMPHNSAIFGLLISVVWLVYFYGANLVETSWFGAFTFDSSEITIVTLYALYIPIFLSIARKEKSFGFKHRYLFPILSIISSVFMVVAAIYKFQTAVIYYLIIFVVVMAIGYMFYDPKKAKSISVDENGAKKK
ncbi:MAG: APC family permease [Ruminococcaceae bacterium]|nr:APC family permease [Oscillospiraceae bacterium]